MDFTFQQYTKLLTHKPISFRHDVDRKPDKSLKMAQLESEHGVKATYYFRMKPESYNEDIIKEIIKLGHEIGYHYESLCDSKGDYVLGLEDFKQNLAKLRKLYPVKKIAMHGRPTSPYDSRDLWIKYDYREFGIEYEPYFDTDYNEVLYITDAGRAWGDDSINRRDRVSTKYDFDLTSLDKILLSLDKNELPKKIIMNIHPEHWADNSFEWWTIYSTRKVRNLIKKIYLRFFR
jgi:hypothetical protein